MPATAVGWQRRRPEASALYRAVQVAWATMRAGLAAAGRSLPRSCVREVEAFLRCGIVAHGFLRVWGEACRKDDVVAFSCTNTCLAHVGTEGIVGMKPRSKTPVICQRIDPPSNFQTLFPAQLVRHYLEQHGMRTGISPHARVRVEIGREDLEGEAGRSG